MAVGDSKTNQTWVEQLQAGIRQNVERASVGGIDAAGMAAIIDSEIADLVSAGVTAPEFSLVNLGANDVSSLPAEVDWKASMSYIIDAIHAQWPELKIYLAKIWVRAYPAACDTLDSWVDDLISSYAYVYAGFDERIWLEGGATYSSDGTHYSPAGLTEAARQWKLVVYGY